MNPWTIIGWAVIVAAAVFASGYVLRAAFRAVRFTAKAVRAVLRGVDTSQRTRAQGWQRKVEAGNLVLWVDRYGAPVVNQVRDPTKASGTSWEVLAMKGPNLYRTEAAALAAALKSP